MIDDGANARMAILVESAERQLVKPLTSHGWQAAIETTVERPGYLIVVAQRGETTKRISLLYSSATENVVYRLLDSSTDAIFTNGELYRIESFAYGIQRPVRPVDEFFETLLAWNRELGPPVGTVSPTSHPAKLLRLTSERPIDAVWARLERLASVRLAAALITRRCGDAFDEVAKGRKAEGLAFSIRNGVDYFRSGPADSLSRRIVCLYYGTLALASAEMLASPEGASDLDQIESFTKGGHGLYVLPSAGNDLGELFIGVLRSGFYAKWTAFLGQNVSDYPAARLKTPPDAKAVQKDHHTTLGALLSAVPELGELFGEVFPSEPSWLALTSDIEDNGPITFKPRPQVRATYVRLVDPSGRVSQDRILASAWPIAELTEMPGGTEGRHYRVRVDHPDHKNAHEVLPTHRSPFFSGTVAFLPGLAGSGAYRTKALVILYALSIVVRYMPSLWRRVEGGDADHYLAVVRMTLDIFERVLPEAFLESITNERIVTRQPGAII